MSAKVETPLPTAELREEHRTIERVLSAVSRLVDLAEHDKQIEGQALRACIDFFRLYADACHHGKEEDLLFPLLDQHGLGAEGSPLACMRREHDEGRKLTRTLYSELTDAESGDDAARRRFCNAARQYVALLHQHIAKEDNVLFALADRMLDATERDDFATKCVAARSKRYGGRTRAEWGVAAENLEQQWGKRRPARH